MSDETEKLLREILAILKRDSPSVKQDRVFDAIASATTDAPKLFKKCGHPFPRVSVMGDGDGCLYEAIYTCPLCGEKEGYP